MQVDIEGGIGNVFANASLRKQAQHALLCGWTTGAHQPPAGRSWATIMVPKEGVAVHINAFASLSGACWRSAP
ncbi:MAG: hypothetical protein R2818_08205 [Flavobacteriales bacterium]